MKPRPLFFFLALICLASLAPCCLAGVKLAIVSDGSFSDSAALLTAELSKDAGAYELLERDAVEHVLAEQGIARSGATASDWAKIGHLLAADGLVLMQKRNMGEKETANIGWVLSVNTGIVLGAEVLPRNGKGQVEVLTGLLNRCLPKMAVKAGEAVPVSVVPAEATDYWSGDGAREIFQNGLMLTLMREPAVFVLQREQLDTILFERDFAGADKQGFWAGANVVQCRVGPDPLNKQVMVAALSLQRRDGTAENWVEKAGTPQELSAAAAASVRERLKLGSTAPAYDPQKEIAYFRQKFQRLMFDRYNAGSSLVDTAVTLLALGDRSPLSEQVAALAPVAKVCGTFSGYKVAVKHKKGTLDRKAALSAARQTLELETARLQKLIRTAPNDIGRRDITDFSVVAEELDLMATLLQIGTDPQDPALKPDMSALRRQVVDYLKLASDAKWYGPNCFVLTHGEYFFDDPNAWLDRVEAVFRPPFPDNPLFYATVWLLNTNLQIPRYQGQTLYCPNFWGEYAKSDPKTVTAILPRMKQWAMGNEPGLRIAGARVLCREAEASEVGVDRTEMARIVVKTMDEIMPRYTRANAPANPFAPYYNMNGSVLWNVPRWLKNVQPLAHKELLDMSIHTLERADNLEGVCLFTSIANKEEAMALGKAVRATEKRLGVPIRKGEFDVPRRLYPEAFAEPSAANASVEPVPEKVSRLIWNSKTAVPQSDGNFKMVAGPSECGGKLWSILLWRDSNARPHLSLLGADIATGAQTLSEIPLPQRERFEYAAFSGNVAISTPQHLVLNDRYLLAGPIAIRKNNVETKEEKVWLILDRQRGGWTDLVVPLGNGVSRHLPPLLLGGSAYWPFSVSHPEKAAGIMEVNCANPGWKFHPCERLAKESFNFPYLVWNRTRNTLVLMSWANFVPEFDLKSGEWQEERPESAGEALVSGAGLRNTADTPGADFGDEISGEFAVDSNTAKGVWNVEALDPKTRRSSRFALAFDFRGAPMEASEKETLHPTAAVGRAILGGRGRTGLWFKLVMESRGDGPFKLFWLPWADVHRGEVAPRGADVVFVKNKKLFAMESGTPANVSLQLGACHEILDRNAHAGSVLIKAIHPTAYLWGRRGADGTFEWRVPPGLQPALSGTGRSSVFSVLSPDGMGVRYIGPGKNEIREWRAENGQESVLFTVPEGEELRNFAYTADASVFAWAGKATVCLQTPSGPLPGYFWSVPEQFPMVWSPDGKRLLASSGGTVKLLERTEQGFNEIRQWKGDRCMWTPDGARVVFGMRMKMPWSFPAIALQTISLADGAISPLVPQFVCEMFTLSADGQSVWAAGCFQADKQRKCLLKISVADGSFMEVLGEGNISQVADLPPLK